MKRIGLSIGLLLVIALPGAAQSKIFEHTVSLRPGGQLRLDVDKGSVRLMGWDRDQVEIRARIEAERSWDSTYAGRVVDATTVDVVSSAGLVSIRGNYDKVPTDGIFGNHVTPNIHYEIRAPRRVDLQLDIDRANSIITGFEGRIDLEADRSVIETVDVNGPIRVSIDRGGDSSFRNVRGSVNVDADRTNLRIDMARLDDSSRIVIDRGNIDMSLARGQGLDLDTSLSRRASFDSSLPLQMRNFRNNNPSGTMNGGGPRLAIQADRSRIRLR